tara:strand:+ start:398 stop:1351 length:954 start_codon:yes stop_codon:yes gene_type:complete
MKFRFKKLKSKIKASSLFRETRAIKISIEHLFEFINYSFKQAIRSYKRNRLLNYNSMLNYKRAHYLEKAMYCELEKTNDLNIIHKELSKYLETDEGVQDDCYLYLEKLRKEYLDYPDNFKCFMLSTKRTKWKVEDKKVLENIIKKRRSIRSFGDEEISDKKFLKVIMAGAYAPSSCNAQPVNFITIKDKKLVKSLMDAAIGAKGWEDAVPYAILVLTDSRHYKPFVQHVIMYQDVAAAIQNCLLMAEVEDLSACWVSLSSDNNTFNQEKIYKMFNIPSYMIIGGLIAIGETSTNVCPVPRRNIKNIWHSNYFNNKNK